MWRKSSYSQSSGTTDCVELAKLDGMLGIRDSKAPEADHIVVSPVAFAGLLSRIKRDELNI